LNSLQNLILKMTLLTHIYPGNEQKSYKLSTTKLLKVFVCIPLDQTLFDKFLDDTYTCHQNNQAKFESKIKKGNSVPIKVIINPLMQRKFFRDGLLEIHYKDGQTFRALFTFFLENYKIRVCHFDENFEVLSEKVKEYLAENGETEDFEHVQQGDENNEDNEKEEEDEEQVNINLANRFVGEIVENNDKAVSNQSYEMVDIPSPALICEECFSKDKQIEELEQKILNQKILIEQLNQKNDQIVQEKNSVIKDLQEEVKEDKAIIEKTLENTAQEKIDLIQTLSARKRSKSRTNGLKQKNNNNNNDNNRSHFPSKTYQRIANRWMEAMRLHRLDVNSAEQYLLRYEQIHFVAITKVNFKTILENHEENLKQQGLILKTYETPTKRMRKEPL